MRLLPRTLAVHAEPPVTADQTGSEATGRPLDGSAVEKVVARNLTRSGRQISGTAKRYMPGRWPPFGGQGCFAHDGNTDLKVWVIRPDSDSLSCSSAPDILPHKVRQTTAAFPAQPLP